MTPKKYKAMTVVPESDPFMGGKSREVQGYYVKHINATPYAISDPYSHQEFVDKHTKHYILCDGFSDWGMPRELEIFEIDIDTLKEVE